MSETNWKHWLLQHERAVASLEKNTVGVVARLHRIPREEIEAFCQAHELDPANLTAAQITAVKVKLGILTTSTAPAQPPRPDAVVTPPAASAPRPPAPAAAPAPKAVAPITNGHFWERYPRGPQSGKLEKYRVDLENLAEGTWGDDPITGDLATFVQRWFGTRNPAPAQVRAFLKRFADAGDSTVRVKSIAPRAAKVAPAPKPAAVKPKAARSLRASISSGDFSEAEKHLQRVIDLAREEIERQQSIINAAEELRQSYRSLVAMVGERKTA